MPTAKMYCIHRPTSSSSSSSSSATTNLNPDFEPGFEPVLPPPPTRQFHPAIDTLSSRYAAGIAIANSSPKLRLTFDEDEHLMTEDDFDSIRQRGGSLLPSPLEYVGTQRGGDGVGGGDIVLRPYGLGRRVGGGDDDVRADKSTANATDGCNSNEASNLGGGKLDVPIELHNQLSQLGLEHSRFNKATPLHQVGGTQAANVYNCRVGGGGSGCPDGMFSSAIGAAAATSAVPVDGIASRKIREKKVKTRPRPLSTLPRLGTLTALPGSTLRNENTDGDEYAHPESDYSTIDTFRKSPAPRIPARTSSLYAPSPVPWMMSTDTPTTTAPDHGSSSTAPHTQPHTQSTNVIPSAIKSDIKSRLQESDVSGVSHKRKLSLSAPFTNNFKRILTRTGSGSKKKKQKETRITHLTHEATAANRNVDSAAKTSGGENVAVDDGPTASPVSTTSVSSTGTRLTIIGPTTATAVHMIPRRDLVTPIFVGPSDSIASTAISAGTTATTTTTPVPTSTPATQHRRTATSLFRPRTHTHSNSSSTSATANPTSKSSLHKMIVQLRGQISDLTLENQVLKDQIAIVRKDWIDTSAELELERHRAWEGEMERFKLGVRVEELRGEMRMLKDGSGDGEVGGEDEDGVEDEREE